MSLNSQDLDTIENYNEEQRLSFLIQQAIEHNSLWILADEHGCVMLNTDDEDCVPVWPNEALAQRWATEEWQQCQAEAITLNKWFSRWTMGLLDDELALVAFPNQQNQGLVIYPDEFEEMLKKAQRKKGRK
ncbi:DUF2750 domain-containing protein [Litorilituus lipolyticus]|uniref:DUF2750 domain-containing protein n=1 Tax=Litorilituus lipolyticus TaxID=2491017 RepID=A0A502KYN2_9GAMM|nr:DUF2750 domain-containing protein [Litorilituus lipolyticus]TPH15579.1 DUF2750 domain-containing protein [Litorilituus lipolyticus]